VPGDLCLARSGRPIDTEAQGVHLEATKLLTELASLEDRRARYVCVIVAIDPTGEEIVAEGTLSGTIAPDRRGAEGFGYDPIFVPDGETSTVAELGDDWKTANSHRARAAARLATALEAQGRG